jgi:hypothetical protein
MLAQGFSSDSGAEALGIIIALAVIALQIYLIYAIIATRQDVKTLRDFLMPRSQSYGAWAQGGPPSFPGAQSVRLLPLRAPLMRSSFEELGNVRTTFSDFLSNSSVTRGRGRTGRCGIPANGSLATKDWARAQQVQALIHQAGGRAEIQESGPPTAPSEQGVGPAAASVTETKTCPDCAEEVRAVARKCRFCGHMFEDVQPPLSS